MGMFWKADMRPGRWAALALGGPADGRHIEGASFHTIFIVPTDPEVRQFGEQPKSGIFYGVRGDYAIRTLTMDDGNGNVRRWSLFVEVGVDDFTVMDRLLQCYRPVMARNAND